MDEEAEEVWFGWGGEDDLVERFDTVWLRGSKQMVDRIKNVWLRGSSLMVEGITDSLAHSQDDAAALEDALEDNDLTVLSVGPAADTLAVLCCCS